MDHLLAGLPRANDPNVLVGFDHNDDAGVYLLAPELAIVQTVDFFTPIVDDPEIFGSIAAANALSDIYAMGGRPVSALSILACPAEDHLDDIAAILRGGALKIHEAGAAIVGGHSVSDPEIKFGYSVTGVIHPDRIKTNSGAHPGDVLILTKPIGTGVISTALKRGIARAEHLETSIASMLALNRAAAELMVETNAHACTDVTGFGLLGHAREMAAASSVTLEIDPSCIDILPGALEYAAAGCIPGGLKNNREYVAPCVEKTKDLADGLENLLYDPQTSGGLLISIAEPDASRFMAECANARRIGRVLQKESKAIRLI